MVPPVTLLMVIRWFQLRGLALQLIIDENILIFDIHFEQLFIDENIHIFDVHFEHVSREEKENLKGFESKCMHRFGTFTQV